MRQKLMGFRTYLGKNLKGVLFGSLCIALAVFVIILIATTKPRAVTFGPQGNVPTTSPRPSPTPKPTPKPAPTPSLDALLLMRLNLLTAEGFETFGIHAELAQIILDERYYGGNFDTVEEARRRLPTLVAYFPLLRVRSAPPTDPTPT